MYIIDTTKNVEKLIERIESKAEIAKLKFLIYIFGLLNNNQINDKNDANPDLIEDENIKIFMLQDIGLDNNICIIFLQYLTALYSKLTSSKDAYEENGKVLEIRYSKEEKYLLSHFGKLSFNEKLDVFSEIVIRYDNETYFKDKITIITFDSKSSGFDIARRIQK